MALTEVVIAVAPAVERRAGIPWIYFGRRGDRLRSLQAGLGADDMLSAAALVDEVAARIRLPFVELDRSLDLSGRELEWDSSTLAERSPYTSGLFYDSCVVVAFVGLLSSADGSLAVYVDDVPLARELVLQARARGVVVVAASRLTTHDWRAPLRPAVATVRGVLRRAAFLVETARRRRRLGPAPELGEIDVAIVTWASPTFTPSTELEYFGPLATRLRERGLRVAFVAQPLAWVHDWFDVATAARRSGEAVIVLEDWVAPRSLLLLAWRTLTARFRIAQPFVLEGVDLTRLLRLELLRERSGVRQLWSMQHALVGERLARSGVRAVIHPYENQAWEKALRTPLLARGIPVVGYQHTPFSLQWLPYFPSTFDLDRRALPSRIVAIGERWRRLLVEHGYPADAVRVGPAFRFADARDNQPPSGHDVVVAAPIDGDETLELAAIVEAAAPLAPGSTFRFRLHPVSDATQLAGRAGLEVTTEPLWELLRHARCLVYTGTSACYEALAAGRPVISLRTELWLDTDPLPWPSAAHIRASGPHELAAAVRDVADADRSDAAHQLLAETLQAPRGDSHDADAFVGGIVE